MIGLSKRWEFAAALLVIVLESRRRKQQTKRSGRGQVAHVVRRLRRFARLRGVKRFAKIETAVALSGNLKSRLRADLVRIYGSALRISFVQSPALIGGMRITVGSDLYDGSVRGTLAGLESTFRD